jgi:hypothetical protein
MAAAQTGWQTGDPAEREPASLAAPHLGRLNWCPETKKPQLVEAASVPRGQTGCHTRRLLMQARAECILMESAVSSRHVQGVIMKHHLSRYIAFGLVALLMGCAQLPELTREEQLAAKTRTFAGTDKEAVIDAARRVLRLQNDDKATFADRRDGFTATQQTLLFLFVMAETYTFTWNFRVSDAPGGGVHAEIEAWTAYNSVSVAPTSVPGLYSPLSLSDRAMPVTGDVAYKLFWSQLEYMLHRTDSWATCDDASAWMRKGEARGNNLPICHFMLAKRKPGQEIPPIQITGANSYQPGPTRIALDRGPRR